MSGERRRTTGDGRPIYKLRRSGKDGYVIAVPNEIANMIPRGSIFAFELTDDGFAYSHVKTLHENGLPDWLMEAASNETSDEE